jgi:hypothetical protein
MARDTHHQPDGVPEDAFALFGHELRVEILFALWGAPDYSLRFSELREAVDERDSGRFSYHLSEIDDRFVRQVDDRYELQYAGHRIVDAIRSGVFHRAPRIDAEPTDGDCPLCGESLAFSYADHIVSIHCVTCDATVLEYPFEPGAFADRTREEAIEAFDRRTRQLWTAGLDHLCTICSGRVETEYATTADLPTNLTRYTEYFSADHPVVVSLDCTNCSFYSYVPVGIVGLADPDVRRALAEAGDPLDGRALWELPFVRSGEGVTIERTDPPRVSVVVGSGEETVTITLDEEIAVEEITRTAPE